MSYSQNMRDELARKRNTRDRKLERIYAKPEQVVRDGQGNIVTYPPGEDSLARAEREAKELREIADREAKARA
jgi:hypothetical protein